MMIFSRKVAVESTKEMTVFLKTVIKSFIIMTVQVKGHINNDFNYILK